jgi:hypothetical protein
VPPSATNAIGEIPFACGDKRLWLIRISGKSGISEKTSSNPAYFTATGPGAVQHLESVRLELEKPFLYWVKVRGVRPEEGFSRCNASDWIFSNRLAMAKYG